jgi:cation/acetate symporter
VTWTQVAQYIILIVAYLIPVVWLSIKFTGIPIPQLSYGKVLEEVTQREKVLTADPLEIEVRTIFAQRAAEAKVRVDGLPKSWESGKAAAELRVARLRKTNASLPEQRDAEAILANYPKSVDEARKQWTAQIEANAARAAPPVPHAEPYFSGNPDPVEAARERDTKRNNFLALAFCLMVGTAALPHILMRFYTTPSVHDARKSVFWSLFFISLLYVTAPALAVLVKFDVYSLIVGEHFVDLPAWVAAWQKVDPKLLSIIDINKDGVVQLAEIVIGQDIVVLATPEIAGLPYVVSGLVAAGGLAAALSTADGLLLTIANALSHDFYFKMINPTATAQRRITMSKVVLLVVAIAAAAVAAQKPADILFLVSAAFSLAASAFFVPLVAGIFWKRANRWGAIAAMLGGVGMTWYYMVTTQPFLHDVFRVSGSIAAHTWFGISPISAGVFGVPVSFVLMLVVSLATPRPGSGTGDFIDHVRYPNLTREAERDITQRS